jgi:transposase
VLTLPGSTLIFLARDPVDGRKGIDSLVALVRSQFGRDPLNGHLFVFLSRRCDRARILFWDRNGYVLTLKRLEVRTFKPAAIDASYAEIEYGAQIRAARSARWSRLERGSSSSAMVGVAPQFCRPPIKSTRQ